MPNWFFIKDQEVQWRKGSINGTVAFAHPGLGLWQRLNRLYYLWENCQLLISRLFQSMNKIHSIYLYHLWLCSLIWYGFHHVSSAQAFFFYIYISKIPFSSGFDIFLLSWIRLTFIMRLHFDLRFPLDFLHLKFLDVFLSLLPMSSLMMIRVKYDTRRAPTLL